MTIFRFIFFLNTLFGTFYRAAFENKRPAKAGLYIRVIKLMTFRFWAPLFPAWTTPNIRSNAVKRNRM